jgi:hypothetical protein
MEEATRI